MTQIYKHEETKDGYETTYRLFVYADGTNKLEKWVYDSDGYYRPGLSGDESNVSKRTCRIIMGEL